MAWLLGQEVWQWQDCEWWDEWLDLMLSKVCSNLNGSVVEQDGVFATLVSPCCHTQILRAGKAGMKQ